MENKPTDIQVQMKISSFNVLRFAQYDIEDFDVNRDGGIEYQSDFRIQIIPESSEIAIETTVKIKVKELDKYFGELKVVMKFYITPFEEVIKKQEEEGYNIPDVLMLNLFHILMGTIRGILYEKLRGTVLQNEVLPLIDVASYLKLNTK